MNKQYKILSYPLNSKTPLYGDTRPIEFISKRQIQRGDSCNTAVVAFANHSGTHIDAPKHFHDSGRSISEYGIEELIFNNPIVIDCPKGEDELIMPDDLDAIVKCDLLLIRTGFYKFRSSKKYTMNNPGISPAAAEYICSKHPYIKAVGVDTISISAYQKRELGRKAHKILLKSAILIEDMNLSGDLSKLVRVFAVPLYLEGVDSMPCTVIGEFG